MPTTTDRTLEYVPLDEIEPHPRNPKDHDEAALAASIARWGFTIPGFVDERTGLLAAGHGRLERLQAMFEDPDIDHPPDGVRVLEDGRWSMPIIRGWHSVDDDELLAYVIADNQGTISGGWHEQMVADILGSFREHEIPVEGIGFLDAEIDDLLGRFGPAPDLDDLADDHGDPDEKSLWPVLRFKVSPQTRERYQALVDGLEGDDHDLFVHVLDLAERE